MLKRNFENKLNLSGMLEQDVEMLIYTLTKNICYPVAKMGQLDFGIAINKESLALLLI